MRELVAHQSIYVASLLIDRSAGVPPLQMLSKQCDGDGWGSRFSAISRVADKISLPHSSRILLLADAVFSFNSDLSSGNLEAAG